jgi:hypothetical protein
MSKKVERTRNDNQWTESRFNSFVRSALRRAAWPPKYQAIRNAYVKDGINPKTRRKCKLHRCSQCDELFPQKDMQADHVIPVIGIEGFVDWNTYIDRLFCEKDGFKVMCKPCHKEITNEERIARAKYKKENNHEDT